MNRSRINKICAIYDVFDDDNISTQTLLNIVADTCNCDIDDVITALIENGEDDDGEETCFE